MLKGWEARFLKVTTTVSWTSAWMVGPKRPKGEKEAGVAYLFRMGNKANVGTAFYLTFYCLLLKIKNWTLWIGIPGIGTVLSFLQTFWMAGKV